MASKQHETERTLQREVARLVEGALPDVDVLALELTGKERSASSSTTRRASTTLSASASRRAAPVPRRYSVEVSSPGFERPLRTRDHFVRAVGRPVRVKSETGRVRGQVVSAGERAVQIAADGEPVDIPYEQIVRANLIDEGK